MNRAPCTVVGESARGTPSGGFRSGIPLRHSHDVVALKRRMQRKEVRRTALRRQPWRLIRRLGRAGCSIPTALLLPRCSGPSLLTQRKGKTLGTVGLLSREDRHGEEDPGVAGAQVVVGPTQKTPLISASRRPALCRGPRVGALGRSKSSAASGWFVPGGVPGYCSWAVVRPTAGAVTRAARRPSSMIWRPLC
jgi:hypothetical protein